MHKLALVIATKDRPESFARLLRSLRDQTLLPEQVIIVDSGLKSLKAIIASVSNFPIQYFHHRPPSISKQRNVGIDHVHSDITLVGFLDDDVELEFNALENMLIQWEEASSTTAGIAFGSKAAFPPAITSTATLPSCEALCANIGSPTISPIAKIF